MTRSMHYLQYQGTTVAQFDSKTATFNAANGMKFDRMLVDVLENKTNPSTNTKLSVLIKPVSNFSPLITDLMHYYRKLGVQHVYLGLLRPSQETLNRYHRALEDFKAFVSIGWFDSEDVTFNCTNMHGHVLLKVMFANSALYHAKAFQDDLLMVADMDDVPVSMKPTKTSISEALGKQIKNDTCFGVVTPHIVWNYDENRNASRLGERFPSRCNNTGFYEKSVAVLKNCELAGIHYHGALS